jgi:GlpG protein
MRQIGHLPSEAAARTFGDYLYAQGIENQIEFEDKVGWALWIAEEDKLETAATQLAEYRKNPEDPKYKERGAKAEQLRAKKEKEEAAWRKKLQDRRHLFRTQVMYGLGPLTLTLILISIGVFFLSGFGENRGRISGLYISWYLDSHLEEVRKGQLWRLLTPIFVHANFLHILFNLWWLKDLGSMIEGCQSTRQLLFLVVGIGIASNLGQYFWDGPAFGGMSGVVYGLLGYIWIRGKLDPGSGLFINQVSLTIMLAWFFACLIGVIPHVANATHLVGLLGGMAWGYLSSLRYR